MTGPLVRYEVRDEVAELLLDNAPVNAITDGLINELLAALSRAREDKRARAVIIASALPGRFCGGLDLGSFLRGSASEVHAIVDKLYAKLCDVQFGLGKPSIAAINGAARGGGMSIAISCDLMVAEATSTFGYPELDIGLVPAIHFTHLPRIVGRYRAFDLLFTGRVFDANEASALGLISRISPEGEVLTEARKLAAVFVRKSPELVRLAKRGFTSAIDSDYRRGIVGAVDLISAVAATDDCREGLTAFVEKRKPVWKRP